MFQFAFKACLQDVKRKGFWAHPVLFLGFHRRLFLVSFPAAFISAPSKASHAVFFLVPPEPSTAQRCAAERPYSCAWVLRGANRFLLVLCHLGIPSTFIFDGDLTPAHYFSLHKC